MARTSRLLACIGISGAAMMAPLVFAAPAQAGPVRQAPWDRWRSARAAVTRAPTPATGITAVSNSTEGLGSHTEEGPTQAPPTTPPDRNRSRSPRRCSARRAGEPGQPAPEGPGSSDARPHHPLGPRHSTRREPSASTRVANETACPARPLSPREYRVPKGSVLSGPRGCGRPRPGCP
jgi:hypothetical protein